MHLVLAVFVWSAFWAILPVKIVAIAGFAYAILQTLKAIFPAITGIYSILLNVAFNIAGVVMFAKPGDFESPALWSSLMLAIASAAGIHGTVKSLTNEPAAASDPNQTQQGIGSLGSAVSYGTEGAGADGYRLAVAQQQKAQAWEENNAKNAIPLRRATDVTDETKARNTPLIALVLFAGLCFGLTGCLHSITAGTPATAATLPAGAIDRTDAEAFLILRPAHDFAASISADIISGKLKVGPIQQKTMETFNKALNVADHAEKNYHSTAGGNAAVLTAAITAVLDSWDKAQVSIASLSAN